MKIVILMRHGKAADALDYTDDFERPLVSRGKAEVREAALKLKEAGIVPDCIISSPANRTAGTARIVADVFNLDQDKILYQARLYGGGKSDYLQILNDNVAKTIMLIGHNPEIGALASHFGGHRIFHYPTSSAGAYGFESNLVDLTLKPSILFESLRK